MLEEVVQLMMGRPLRQHHLDVSRPSSNSSSSPSLPISKNSAPCSTTIDLLGASSSSSSPTKPHPPLLLASEDPESSSSACCFDLDADAPLPSGWEKCLDLQTGNIYYLNRSTGLSTSCDPIKHKLANVPVLFVVSHS
ncbi:hypothetical protein GOP47_0020929 [Adiantum capillus-veneris]|uniref:WW domain-containing protein n=1 Tax=Adiantum capillus-veneris TaxID=13818 RepID=A0A9D4UBP8_ADICA|nr:hypothetical protein GOP47_0020929 [Adiantum capillus-veneris]